MKQEIAPEKAVAMSEYGNVGTISDLQEVSAERVNWQPDPDPAQWFALAVKPRCDKAVAKVLEVKGYETFLPLYRKSHQYATRLKVSELPLFPGYVFCRFDPRTRLPILITPGVSQILGAGNAPLPMCEQEIFSLQTAMKAGLTIQPFPFLQLGQKVRINHGVLRGVEGIVIHFKQYLRLVLSITALQRSVLLEIDRDQVSAEQTLELAA
jgi:transcription antitermination factor NusG